MTQSLATGLFVEHIEDLQLTATLMNKKSNTIFRKITP